MTVPRRRNLTDADVEAIVTLLKTELVADFYGEVGRGAWSWIKKAMFGLLLAFAIYAAASDRGIFHPLAGLRLEK